MLSRFTSAQPLTPAENVLVVSVATAAGTMPITAGFVGIIPALEYIIGPEENGPLHPSLSQLMLWSTGLCFFGILFASVLREHFVERENLPWPGARASGDLINIIHQRSPQSPVRDPNALIAIQSHAETTRAAYRTLTDDEPSAPSTQQHIDLKATIKSLIRGTTIAGGIVWILLWHRPLR
jgi:uncharacterized oligopeptide transporter (OPT) family protein